MGRIDDIRKQNEDLNITLLDIILSVDPTNTYKYSQFLIKMIKEVISPDQIKKVIGEGMFGEDRIDMLKKFEGHCQANRIKNSDISKYKTWGDIKTSVDAADEVVKLKELEKQVIKLHEDNDWSVVLPQTFEASKVYGAGTKWCTTKKTHWDSYFPNYKLIYIIQKSTDKKYAISRKYDDDSKIQAWLSNDEETSPLLLPLPEEIMIKVISEVRKGKNDLVLNNLALEKNYEYADVSYDIDVPEFLRSLRHADGDIISHYEKYKYRF